MPAGMHACPGCTRPGVPDARYACPECWRRLDSGAKLAILATARLPVLHPARREAFGIAQASWAADAERRRVAAAERAKRSTGKS